MPYNLSTIIISSTFFCALLLAPVQQAIAENSFTVRGAHKANIKSASAVFSFNKYAKVWMLQIKSSAEYKRMKGQGVSINLFFSKDFTPAKGTFPVKFSYLSKKDTLGASLTVSGAERGMFSHDSEGSVTFESFDTEVKGKFSFLSYQGEPLAGAPQITAAGTFELPRGEALPQS